MKSTKKHSKRKPPEGRTNLLTDERAQATTEYILMLAVAVSFCMLAIRSFIKPAIQLLTKLANDTINNQLLKADLHRFRVRK